MDRKQTLKKYGDWVSAAASAAACIVLAIGNGLFLGENAPIMRSAAAYALVTFLPLAVAFGAAIWRGYGIFYKKEQKISIAWLNFAVDLVLCAATVYLVLRCMLLDFFQPLAISGAAQFVLLLGLIVMIVKTIWDIVVFSATRKTGWSNFAVTVGILVFIAAAMGWNAWQTAHPEPYTNTSFETTVFEKGADGYNSYRIPSMISVKNNLYAFAEARKTSAKDTGEIDLVVRHSSDGGRNWSPTEVVRKFAEGKGKIGNPVPIYDEKTDTLHLIYIAAKDAPVYAYKLYRASAQINADGSLKFSETSECIANEAYIPGPGRGVVTADGRMLFSVNYRGAVYAMYSDDEGRSWQKSKVTGDGNECEVTLLPDGRIMMAIRENYRQKDIRYRARYAYSSDGGTTWSQPAYRDNLPVKTCMLSVYAAKNGTVYTSMPMSAVTRANMSVAISHDGGETFSEVKPIYRGASGYSHLAEYDGKICMLFENGATEYSQKITFAVLVER